MSFIRVSKTEDLKESFFKGPYNFYFNELMDIYAHAKDLNIRLDVINRLIELQSQPDFILQEKLL